MELQQIKDIESVAMDDLLVRARILTTGAGHGGKEVAALTTGGPAEATNKQFPRHPRVDERSSGIGELRWFRGHCFRCGGPHMVRECKEPRRGITCFRCGKTGHIASRCDWGNGQGGAAAPAATPQSSNGASKLLASGRDYG